MEVKKLIIENVLEYLEYKKSVICVDFKVFSKRGWTDAAYDCSEHIVAIEEVISCIESGESSKLFHIGYSWYQDSKRYSRKPRYNYLERYYKLVADFYDGIIADIDFYSWLIINKKELTGYEVQC